MNASAQTSSLWQDMPVADRVPGTLPAFGFRVRHQFMHECRASWRQVLLWILTLGVTLWQSFQERKPGEIEMPNWLPSLLALVIIIRSVSRDRPNNVDALSHTMPSGRGAVWFAKLLFFAIALLLPWLACAAPERWHLGFGVADWGALIAGRALLAVMIGSFTCVGACLVGSTTRTAIVVILGLAMLALISWAYGTTSWLPWDGCALILIAVMMTATAILCWWRLSVRRDPRITWMIVAFAVAASWATAHHVHQRKIDWRKLPVPAYTEHKLAIQTGPKPDGHTQELWPHLFVTGLPLDRVASVISFGPSVKALYSDYQSWDSKIKSLNQWKSQTLSRDHLQTLRAEYRESALWHGSDLDSRPSLTDLAKRFPEAITKPWRLKLAVQKLRRVSSQPLRNAVQHGQDVVIDPGTRLTFQATSLNSEDHLFIKARLDHAEPRLFRTEASRRHRLGIPIREHNFIAVTRSPSIHEVRYTLDGIYNYPTDPWLLEKSYSRETSFTIPHPRPQMDIAGLTLDGWINDSTLDLWVKDECGVIELQVTPEQLKQVLATD